MSIKEKIVVGVGIIAVLILIFVAVIHSDKKHDYYVAKLQEEKEECNKLDNCEQYGCLANLAAQSGARNLLLKEQNCLLRRQTE